MPTQQSDIVLLGAGIAVGQVGVHLEDVSIIAKYVLHPFGEERDCIYG